MKPFTKTIRRVVKIRSSDRAMPDRDFVIVIGPSGLTIREFGAPKEDGMGLSWRSVIGHVLIHKGVIRPREVPASK